MTDNKEKFIPFTNDFMFSLVMRNKEICLGVLNLILPEENFTDIIIVDSEKDKTLEEVITQAVLKFGKEAKGVRFDVYMKSQNAWASIEMQVYYEINVPKRSRYYQANMDIDALNEGKNYDKLPKEYVIFICTYDFMGKDEPIYYFESYEKNLGLPFGDEVYKIVLNTKCSPDKVPEKLKPLYDYINNPENEIKDKFIKRLDGEVRKYNNNEWRKTLMTLEDIMDIRYKIGREDGWNAGREDGWNAGREDGSNAKARAIALKLKESGMPIAQIAECTELTDEEIKALVE